mmetsp:Transcript_106162/g.297187  ORF Transcript_106162/g.297187 Transcript_106162/m.297187 type:complete len:209 (+) Transcript_106162:709-1335(+)
MGSNLTELCTETAARLVVSSDCVDGEEAPRPREGGEVDPAASEVALAGVMAFLVQPAWEPRLLQKRLSNSSGGETDLADSHATIAAGRPCRSDGCIGAPGSAAERATVGVGTGVSPKGLSTAGSSQARTFLGQSVTTRRARHMWGGCNVGGLGVLLWRRRLPRGEFCGSAHSQAWLERRLCVLRGLRCTAMKSFGASFAGFNNVVDER